MLKWGGWISVKRMWVRMLQQSSGCADKGESREGCRLEMSEVGSKRVHGGRQGW